MPRQALSKEDKKKAANRAKMAELMGLETPITKPSEDRETASRAAEATLYLWEHPRAFKGVVCKFCERKFVSTRGSISYCSDPCRVKALAEIGIEWDYSKRPEERWNLIEPLTVPAEVVRLIIPSAVLSDLNRRNSVPQIENTETELHQDPLMTVLEQVNQIEHDPLAFLKS